MSKKLKPIEIKISTVVAVSVIIRTADLAALASSMKELTVGAADYFDNEFAIIDVGSIEGSTAGINWAALVNLLKSHGLNPVAVRNAAPEAEKAILAHGLSLDNVAAGRADQSTEAPAQAAETAPVKVVHETAAPANAMVIDTPVRAGQRIYARGTDLIVTAAVNNGAELIADGSIHVYAPLRGRALAGASGNTEARIYAMSMEAELVSIAGIYRTFANDLPSDVAKKAAQVRLVGDRIDVLPMQ